MSSGFVSKNEAGALLRLRVSPGAKVSAVEGPYGENAVRIKVAAPPVDGRANAELRRYLAGLLGVPRSRVEVVKGVTGRDKTVLLRGMEAEDVAEVLAAARE